ncbi:uncharacterized protein LOC105440902 [Strongylocentrotus purpuratus]|uniref:SWIM-type domain-containing protein n=3 Tax=Strongylocentrotus purpuratus TaxID=7668 RepID=A0A7M7HEZ6_STRPU|nr:uncharacterized protein LOC105440902 [Strongylocentrotus purpuratus]
MMCLDNVPLRLRAILPDDLVQDIHVCSFDDDDGPNFSATFRLKTKTIDSWQQWLSAFQETKVTWRVKTTMPACGRSVIFKKQYRCQHGQQRNKQYSHFHPKNTNCVSTMTVTIRKTEYSRKRQSRSLDTHMPEWPTQVVIAWNHNHVLDIPASLKYRDVGEDAVKNLQELFEQGHSPQTALTILHSDMQVDDPEGYITKSADRAVCPDLQFCYRLYYHIFKQKYGAGNGQEMIDAIEERVFAPYNAEMGMKCVSMTKEDDHIIIAICTPMMRRVHTTRQSGEMVFIDSTGNIDRHGSRLFILLTHNSAGGLPLGIMITSCEQQSVIEKGLNLLTEVMPPDCFNGRGAAGPNIFITDDCTAERTALRNVYPSSTLLLCIFHVLQAAWRWLWDSKHGIPKGSRQPLFQNIKRIMYASTPEEAATIHSDASEDPLTLRYPKYLEYLNALYERRAFWALSFRSSLLVRGNNTNNYAEAAMRVLKDNILHRTKAFNIPQLVHFILSRLGPHYQRKLVAVANQRPMISTRMKPTSCKKEDISKTGEMTYEVKSSDGSSSYCVDMSVGVCSCPAGVTGDACKHQAAIHYHLKVASDNFLPSTPEERAIMLNIATGGDAAALPHNWLGALQDDGIAPLEVEETTDQPDEQLEERPQRDSLEVEETTDQPDEHLEEPISSQDGDTSQECANLAVMFDTLKRKLENNPETFKEPVNAMYHTFQKMTDNNMVSAMFMFGKYGTTNLAPRRFLGSSLGSHGPNIGVQPTAIARRKAAMGGRRRLTSGRPTKDAAVAEHGYSRTRSERVLGVHQTKRSRVAAPHSLSHATSMNVALGKTHSAQ